MAILTATEVTVLSDISASAATITAKGLIPIIQERVTIMTNNYFVTDLYLQDTMTFNTTARTIVASNSFSDENFLAGDDIYVYGSYRNDGYYTVESVSAETLTLASGSTVVDELSGKSILVSVVKWPNDVKKIAAEMIAYDFDERPKRKGIKSRTLGPFTESYGGIEGLDGDGYPVNITDGLSKYRIARLM